MIADSQTKPTTRKYNRLLTGMRMIAVALFAYLYWQILTYLKRLGQQPDLKPLAVPEAVGPQTTILEKSLAIAESNIRAAIERRRLHTGQERLVLCAGLRNFREPWAQISGFASYGLIEMGEWQTARDALEVFFLNQHVSGQFPVKVHSTNFVDRYLHSLFKREQPTVKPIKPKYMTAHNTISLDGNALLVIAILNYAERTGDHDFACEHWRQLTQAVRWMESHADPADGLLHQSGFADWADSVGRSGKIIYTNVLYWKAVHELAAAAAQYRYSSDYDHFRAKADGLKQAINKHFWRDDLGYFVTSHLFDSLSSSGNLTAIAWGLTTSTQATAILDTMAEFGMASPIPTQVTSKPYPRKFIALENRIGGIANYHTSAAWLWLGAWHVIALARQGRLDEARTLRQRMAEVIVRDGVVHEVYAPNGTYLSSLWYTSEAPLTWNAGMVVYAHHVYEGLATEIGCNDMNTDSDLMTKVTKSQVFAKYRRYALFVLIAFMGLIFIWLGWGFIQPVITFLSNQEAVTAYIERFGIWGPLLLALLLGLQVIVSVIPGHVILIVGGYLYGFWGALALHMVATVGASQVAFALARRAGQPVVNHVAPEQVLDKWNAIAEKQGFIFFLLFFWFPIVPSGLMNFVAGLSAISFWHFLAANFLGRLPGVVLITLIGSHGLELTVRQWIILGLIGLCVFVGGRYGGRSFRLGIPD